MSPLGGHGVPTLPGRRVRVLVERGGLHATVRPEPGEGFDGMKYSTTTGLAVGPFAALRMTLICVSLQTFRTEIEAGERGDGAREREAVGDQREMLRPYAHRTERENGFATFGESAQIINAFIRVTRAG